MKKENRLLTIDGETLMSQPLTPLNFVVDTLLSQGLHILAGSPKVGKSWLALWLAVTVAKGEAVWGMGVKQGTTLYLCLEDSTLRIQNRLFEITEDAPASVHFTTNSDTLGKGLEEQLRAFLSEHPDTVLVIIDTLQMIRGTGYDNTYANDYRDLSVLKHQYSGIDLSANGGGSTASALVGLGHRLEQLQPAAPVMPIQHYTDRKVLQKEREKKIALGHKADDHEDEVSYDWQQTM